MADIQRTEELTLSPSTSRIKITFDLRADGTPITTQPTIKYYYRDYDQNSRPYKSGVITLKSSDLVPSDLFTVLTIFKAYFDAKYLAQEDSST